MKSYLHAKSRWLSNFSHTEHTIIAASSGKMITKEPLIHISGIRIPFSPGMRWVPRKKPIETLLRNLHPDCIEVSDPFQFAKAAINLKQENNIFIGALCHFDPSILNSFRAGIGQEDKNIKKLSRLYSHFDLVFVSSLALTEKLRKTGLRNIHYHPPGVDTTIFTPHARDDSMRDRLDLHKETILLVYVEYSANNRDPRILLETIRRLEKQYHLIIIGNRTKNINSEKVSYFYFNQDIHTSETLATLIASCDILIHPELNEYYPLSIVEGMSCGLPVVAFKSGSAQEIIDNKTGYTINAICPQKMAETIIRLHKEKRQQMGRQARKKAEAAFDWNYLFSKWRAQYVSVLASKGNYPKTEPSELTDLISQKEN